MAHRRMGPRRLRPNSVMRLEENCVGDAAALPSFGAIFCELCSKKKDLIAQERQDSRVPKVSPESRRTPRWLSPGGCSTRRICQTLLGRTRSAYACVVIAILSMPTLITKVRRRAKALHRNLRGANMAIRALASTDHPLLAHIIPTVSRRWS
jgi:hypothetical protein